MTVIILFLDTIIVYKNIWRFRDVYMLQLTLYGVSCHNRNPRLFTVIKNITLGYLFIYFN